MEPNQIIEQLTEIKHGLIGEGFPASFAKLYSQYTHVSMKQPGLLSWSQSEFVERFSDATVLIDVGLQARSYNMVDWRETLRQGAELLEWLSAPGLNFTSHSLNLLSAGVYQIAGYPALALGILKNTSGQTIESKVLASLLKGDFSNLFKLILEYLSYSTTPPLKKDKYQEISNNIDFTDRVMEELVKSLGIISSYIRWGEENRLEKAIIKLQELEKLMLYSKDSFSWLLAKVISEVAQEYIRSSLRSNIKDLKSVVSIEGHEAFEKYLKSNYQLGKSLAWNSQISGIEKLVENKSFTLCTPTGSGKTTVAELAIIQSMFTKKDEEMLISFESGKITMYLVPSRALATEVEAKLSNVMGNLGSSSVKVTGLYGGIDWGPTDAWITSNDPTILICTYEKAEALIRFLGPLFLKRVTLVVIDEVHSVQYNGRSHENLRNGESRSLRLETLVNRLLSYTEGRRIIALSAVANNNSSLAKWVAGNKESHPILSDYRSTRHLVGRLEWNTTGNYEIRFDILNGSALVLDNNGEQENVPYIYNPFSNFPIHYDKLPKKFTNKEVGKRQRPYLFWAAMQLAQPDEQGNQKSVLISITQHINGYAEDFLYVLNKTFKNETIPSFFNVPSDTKSKDLYEKCLMSCKDYFGDESNEYKLLERGIVLHHGKMPGLLARLMIQLLQKNIINLALATSTLSEGVNLPFETVIVPTLVRNGDMIPLSEFKNLSGRAGRPGVSTEGRTLIFLEKSTTDISSRTFRRRYITLIENIKSINESHITNTSLSPLATLIKDIAMQWAIITGSSSFEEFTTWLETTIPFENEDVSMVHEEALDSLDSYLISILVEHEEVVKQQLSASELEIHLQNIWQKTYAYQVNINKTIAEQRLEEIFKIRGVAINEKIYTNADERRKLYRTSVVPRFGKKILAHFENIKNHLFSGSNYATDSITGKLDFIIDTIEIISLLENFKVEDRLGRTANSYSWKEILKWWLCPTEATEKPTNKSISKWIEFVKQHFEYKFNWGLGTILSLLIDEVNEGVLTETSIQDWPKTGLPWIVFWMKELIIWGTLDPVATLLLAYGIESTREEAEIKALDYYTTSNHLSSNEILNPTLIKEWVNQFIQSEKTISSFEIEKELSVELKFSFERSSKKEWNVFPVFKENIISWLDLAGYELAISERLEIIEKYDLNKYDFILDVTSRKIRISSFM